MEIPINFWNNKLWGRISAQVYNQLLPDYQKLADAICELQTESAHTQLKQ